MNNSSCVTRESDREDESAASAAFNDKTKDVRLARASLRPFGALKPYLSRYRGMVLATVFALLAAALATLAVPLGVRRMIDFGFSAENATFIDKYFAMLIVVGLVLAVASAARFYCVTWLGERIVADLRRDVFARLATVSPAFYEHTHSGEVMSRLTADTTQIKAAISTAISQTLRNSVLFLGALAMMFVTSVKLSLLVLAAIPLIVLPLVAYGRVVRRLSRHAQDSVAEAAAYASENLGAIRTMQAYTSEASVTSRFASAVDGAFVAAKSRMRARAGLTAITIFSVFASVVAILWYGSSEVLAGNITAGRLGQFVLYAVFAAGAMGELSEVWGEIQQASGAAERLGELLAVRSAVQSPANPVDLPEPSHGEISFENVSFFYPLQPDSPALKDVSFRVAPGETVAVVGPSGAGKSTIFGLLLRFYDPTRGVVTIDGVDVSTVDVEALRKRMALVPQDVALFADTIAENIRYGAFDASREKVRLAAHTALADVFIRDMPKGYDTILGERGATLSGGQRQRIAIARAILRDAPILLLDEATSALDSESEALVQKAINGVMKGRTTIVIAHRLATVQSADRILVMDNGRIVEQGSHSELTARSGLYSRLAKLQFSGEAAQ